MLNIDLATDCFIRVVLNVYVYAPGIHNAHTPHDILPSWQDELSFPMLVKNSKTGERNVLCLYRLEAENVPDVSPIHVRMMVLSFTHMHQKTGLIRYEYWLM